MRPGVSVSFAAQAPPATVRYLKVLGREIAEDSDGRIWFTSHNGRNRAPSLESVEVGPTGWPQAQYDMEWIEPGKVAVIANAWRHEMEWWGA